MVQEIQRKDVPAQLSMIRAWDKAAQVPSKDISSGNADPDYTANVKMGKDSDGNIYIFGDYCRDDSGKELFRFRERVGRREALILEQAYKDGLDTVIYLPKDPAQAGIFEFEESQKKLAAHGFTVMQDPSPSNRSKVKRFEPFVAACYANNVYWVKDSFDLSTWDYIMLELDNFDGDKNNGYHDDVVDSFSTAFSASVQRQIIPVPPTRNSKLPDNRNKTSHVRYNLKSRTRQGSRRTR